VQAPFQLRENHLLQREILIDCFDDQVGLGFDFVVGDDQVLPPIFVSFWQQSGAQELLKSARDQSARTIEAASLTPVQFGSVPVESTDERQTRADRARPYNCDSQPILCTLMAK
jgi:hypothetical protein